MKKVLALVLALCMVFAMGTVAFAALEGNVTQLTPNADTNDKTVLIKTKLSDEQKPSDFDKYTVCLLYTSPSPRD